MPYRIEIHGDAARLFDRLVDLGALDAEPAADGGLVAIMPDSVDACALAGRLGIDEIAVSPALGRDDGSVWILTPRAFQIGRLRIAPAEAPPGAGVLRLIDAPAFGTGLHPTTALCLEALDELVEAERPEALLDVGTGSGVLALAALRLGVSRALAIDIDEEALRVAAENARLNGLAERLTVLQGGPDRVTGAWPLVVANVLAAPLIEMAPALAQRVGHGGALVLSGIPTSVAGDVSRAYRHRGMHGVRELSRGGWVALVLRASW